MSKRICTIEGCSNPHVARGWCKKHYYYWHRNGDPLLVKRFDDPIEAIKHRTEWQGDCLVWKGTLTNDGYGRIKVNGKLHNVHRLVYETERGMVHSNQFIDHECSNPACVNINHLRVATISENNSYLSGAQANNKNSGIRNVYRARDKFYVRVRKNGQAHYFGVYDTAEEASTVAEQARKEVFGDFAGKG